MDHTFFDGHDKLYHHAKFGEDCTTRAGCRCENVVFVFFCHAPSAERHAFDGVRTSNTHCVAVYRPISTRFGSFFWKGLHFQTRHIFLTFVARWRHNFR